MLGVWTSGLKIANIPASQSCLGSWRSRLLICVLFSEYFRVDAVNLGFLDVGSSGYIWVGALWVCDCCF